MEFVETPTYKKESDRLLNDEERREIEAALIQNPARGDVIPGSSGLRKFRMKYRGRGSRGGLRVIHYYFQGDTIILTAVYVKTEKTDLTMQELKEIVAETSAAVEEKKRE